MSGADWNTGSKVSISNFDVPTPVLASPGRRHPLNVLMGGALAVALLALVCVTFAVYALRSTNVDLQGQLTCRSSAAVVVDLKTSAELSSIGQAQATTLQALAAIQVNDEASLKQAIDLVPTLVASLQATSNALDAAVAARQASITGCR